MMEAPQRKKKMAKLKNISYDQSKVQEWISRNCQVVEEPKPLFISNKEVCVTFGKNINVYNPLGGSLLRVLHGHEHRVISLWRSQDSESENLISCDSKGNIHSWCENEANYKNIFSLPTKFLTESVVTYCVAGKDFYVMTMKSTETMDMPQLFFIPSLSPYKVKCLNLNVMHGKNTVALSSNEKYLAAIKLGELFVINLTVKNVEYCPKRFHNTGRYQLTCMNFHPYQSVLATAAETGVVWLWYNIMERCPVKVKLHWHTCSPGDLCFSPTGAELYSAGVESVIVKWHLKDKMRKSFLPRLEMPICFLTTDLTSSLMAILHNDCSVSIVDTREMRLEGVIERLTVHKPIENYSPMSIGLLFHPPTGSLVKNGRTGHLQFFNPNTTKVTYNLDITMTNLLSQERHKQVSNVDVTKAAMSSDGLWLVTSESCRLTTSLNEIVFKFWFYDKSTQRWMINTHVQMPHDDIVNDISFRPTPQWAADEALCASSSEDGKLKIWRLAVYEDKGTERSHWTSGAIVEFRGLPATACNFSPDGSLLAVAFNAVLTLWNTEDTSLAGSLSQPFLTERILDVYFSHGELGGSYLVSRSEGYLCSWNLVSCSLMWRVFMQSTCLAVDTHSPLMAVFNKEKEVFFFDPRSSQPVSSSSDLCTTKILCSVFVSEGDENARHKSCNSLLYCFDVIQDFFTLDPSLLSEERGGKPLTPAEELLSRNIVEEEEGTKMFSALVAKSRTLPQAHNFQEEEIRVSLVAPSINSLVKNVHDLRIHTLSFTGLVSHLGTFLPDLSHDDYGVNEGLAPAIKYTTIKEKEIDEKRRLKGADQLVAEEERIIKDLQKLDYGQLVQHNCLS